MNIRYNNPDDGINSWDNRKIEMVSMLEYYHPAFLGLQEVLVGQMNFLKSSLKDYACVGVGREDGKEKGEFSPIFFDTSEFELIATQTFWLSEQPDKVSKDWDAALERICTYGKFRLKNSGTVIHVFNTHFDHMGVVARTMSAKLILKKIGEFAGRNSILVVMGDLNCPPESEPVQVLKAQLTYDKESSPKGLYGPDGTFNGFDGSRAVTELCDYIFTRNLEVLNYRHVDDKMKNGNFLSDHYPVLTEIRINRKR